MSTTRYAELGLSDDDVLRMYRAMVLCRTLDERMWLMNRQGLGHFAVPTQGHEATAVGYAVALQPGHDFVYPHYRDLAGLLLLGLTAREVMLNYLARADDPFSRARQNYAHWGIPRLRVITLSSPQGPAIPHGVGTALACKLRREDAVTWIGFGDGASSKGDFHESLNFAATHKVPAVFCCENNRIAISVPQYRQMAVEDVALRAAGYGMPGVVVDGNDPLAVYQAARTAIERARAGDGPTLIETKLHRLMPHTSNDDDRYRTKEELESLWRDDPLPRFRTYLTDSGVLTGRLIEEIDQWATAEVDQAIDFAMNSPEPDPSELFDHVYLES